jgi:hypothetical protein
MQFRQLDCVLRFLLLLTAIAPLILAYVIIKPPGVL